MKRQSLLLFMSALLFLVSCQEKIDSEAIPQISIERVASDDTVSVTVRFVPGENVAYYRYAIGQEEDYDSFVAGIMETMGVEESSESREVVFSDLEPGRTYTVFAQAFTESDAFGSVATMKIPTANNDVDIHLQYISDVSAGFVVGFGHMYYNCRYYLGKDSDREAFLSGNVEAEYIVEPLSDYECVNYFDLEPDSEYVFFYELYDRFGISTGVRDLKFRTYSTGTFPDATIEKSLDLYKSRFSVIPGEDAYMVVAVAGPSGFMDFALQNWGYDYDAMLENWNMSGYNGTTSVIGGKNIELDVITSPVSNTSIELYTVIKDEEGKTLSIKKYDFVNHIVDPSLGEADVILEVTDVSGRGATYSITPNENTFGYFYDTVDAEWYDDLVEKGEITDDEYICNYFFSNFGAENSTIKFSLANNGVYTWTEYTASAQTRYYATVCPFNGNGVGEGWGKLNMVEYKTK